MVVDSLKQMLPGAGKPAARLREVLGNLDLTGDKKVEIDEFLTQAYNFAEHAHQGQKRKSGEPYFEHCSQVGLLLSEWNMDPATIASGFLHDVVEDTDITEEELSKLFGTEVAYLVEGVTKLSDIKFRSRAEQQAENYMKMLLSVAKDIRVILIKFADRLHNMRTIKYLPLIKQRRIAIETRDVYAPLAHRLGMAKLKWELEDLTLQTLDPDVYGSLVKQVRNSRSDREKYIKQFAKPIQEQLEKFKVDALIHGRTKHYYSIYGKLQRRKVSFDEIYDILAVRIVTERIDECYAALGIVHQLYTPIQERFKDFIATPKMNGYQSLHTTVVGPGGKVVEVQLRTRDMDQTAEIGVAAHWRYKEGAGRDPSSMDRQVRWLRELVDMVQNEESTPEEFLDLLQIDLFKDEIFVFTPKGDVIQLPVGASPVDMAFAIHTEVGQHCVGCRVNGKIVPLNSQLGSGDTVEIITSAQQTPNHAWLKFVRTTRAKTRIRRFMRHAQQEESVRLGTEVLEKTLRRLKLSTLLKQIRSEPSKSGYDNEAALHAAIGRGDITVRHIIERLAPDRLPDEKVSTKDLESTLRRRLQKSARGIRVDGISDLLISLSKCCNPIPGDEIIGFVTRGRGITVHRVSCSNLPMMGEERDRYVEVDWDIDKRRDFIVPLKITAEDRKHFLKDVTELTSKMNTNISSVDLVVEDGILTLHMAVEVDGVKKLERIKNKIRMIPGIIYMERL